MNGIIHIGLAVQASPEVMAAVFDAMQLFFHDRQHINGADVRMQFATFARVIDTGGYEGQDVAALFSVMNDAATKAAPPGGLLQ